MGPIGTNFIGVFIAGVQASIWFVILLVGLLGCDSTQLVIAELKDWSALTLVLFFCLSYTLGTFVDRLAYVVLFIAKSSCLYRLCRKVHIFLESSVERRTSAKMYAGILGHERSITELLQYDFGRIRIARATGFNLIFFVLVSLVFRRELICCLGTPAFVNLVLLSVVLFIISLTVLASIHISYETSLDLTSEYIQRKDESSEG